MKKYINNFEYIKHSRDFSRVYPSDMWKWFKANGDTFTIIDSHGDATHHTYRHLEDFFIKHNLKNGLINRKSGLLYVETYNARYGSITDRYLVVNKKMSC